MYLPTSLSHLCGTRNRLYFVHLPAPVREQGRGSVTPYASMYLGLPSCTDHFSPRDLNPEDHTPILTRLALPRSLVPLYFYPVGAARLTDLGSLTHPASGVPAGVPPPGPRTQKGCLHFARLAGQLHVACCVLHGRRHNTWPINITRPSSSLH
ncbi:hypothetical protein GGI42DRAFT_83697 [Trichoderma sp. SZMC 28013]